MGGIEMLCVTHGMPHFSGGFLLCCWDALRRAGMQYAVLAVCYVFCVFVWVGCSLRLHILFLSSFPRSNSDKQQAGEKLHPQTRQHSKVAYRTFKHHQHQTLKPLQAKPGRKANFESFKTSSRSLPAAFKKRLRNAPQHQKHQTGSKKNSFENFTARLPTADISESLQGALESLLGTFNLLP